ncbi:ankyrin repeat domain-containing protein [Endozoicomonas sp. YOMI1]|uniref:ankyrin repeat domain-containing protein n=1 Tax=Endozoicomonas sp. YOMI1 TaxID=2828739 RepID=UPI0021473B73|nr:ankyrin repeat domain-containing protein [Endozoicomonas sp. YOMI1]
MQPIRGMSTNPSNPGGMDKTTSVTAEKDNPVIGAAIGVPLGQGMSALRSTENTVPSESLHTKRMVKLNQARFIPGRPSPKSCDNQVFLQSSNNLPAYHQMLMDMFGRPFLSREDLWCQRNHLNNSYRQALINLIKQGDKEKVTECITNNPRSLAIKDADGNSALHLAVLHGHDDLCRLLVNRAQNLLRATNNNGERPLHIAAREKQNKCLNFLLDNYPSSSLLEIDLKIPGKSHATPVQLAARYGNTVGLMAMLDYEFVRHMLSWLDTPIRLAIENGHTECVAAILSNKKTADALFKPYYFYFAVEYGQLDCLKLLLQKYPDSFTTKNPFLKCLVPLIQLAIKSGHDDILQYLLEQPFFINRLTKMEYASEFECKENGTCAKLIRDAREKVKLPFCPVKNFDKKLFQQVWQREADNIANKKNMVEKQASRMHLFLLPDQPVNCFPGRISSTDYLSQVKALISGLQEIGVYLRCTVAEDAKKGQFTTMGDATASVGLIKTLVALGTKTIHAQLLPPDDSDFITRQEFSHEEQIRYIKKQRVALSKLAYLLPGIKIKPGTQEIYIKSTRVIISTCHLRGENKINAAVTLSFFGAKVMYQQLGHVQESCISLKPYRFHSKCESMYLDTGTSFERNDKNNGNSLWSLLFKFLKSTFTDKLTAASINDISLMPDCNITPLHLPANSIIPSDDLQRQATKIPTESVDSHRATLTSAINQLCDLSTKGKIQTAVVYGLHHGDLRHDKTTILTNWLSAIKINQEQVTDALPVVVTTTVSAFTDEDGKSALYEIARTTGFTLIDFRDQQDRASLMAAGKGQLLLCLMPSLPRQSFNKLVQSSRLPVLSEGANLTTTLLQNGQPHLSLLPYGHTPVAQDMGGPLEALKALAFSCKLRIERKGADIEVLKKLSDFVRESRYPEALSYIDKIIKTKSYESGPLGFVWAEPQPSPLQLRPVTIMSLLHKGDKLGDIEKKALIAALDPSDKALANYINSCLDKESITTYHFRLQQMHVNKPFNNKVLAALFQFGRHKKLLA